MKQLQGTGRDSKRQTATIRDSERHADSPWDRRDTRESQQLQETVRDMKHLYWTGETVRDSQQTWETVRDM